MTQEYDRYCTLRDENVRRAEATVKALQFFGVAGITNVSEMEIYSITILMLLLDLIYS